MMTTTEAAAFPDPQFNRQQMRAAIERGELVRLLAELEAGRISPQQLEAALEEFDKAHWARRMLAAIIGR